ncbi:MAG: tRNA preQ1(34) S-adenosylmethionine ribosyltransferase-isomerase QueA [Gemmatimonadetes bacterium]|nr:tRNA preQ1(34) S-adenosylmethionine ribosyltransferase-isomerase QueA [Gemmatimonadota bacterium]
MTNLPPNRSFTARDFDYELAPEFIAQWPAERGTSRLLVLHRHTGAVEHRHFRDFPSLLRAGDVLVINTTKVIPARLSGTRDNGRAAEILLVHPEPDGSWLAMVHPGGKLKRGRVVRFGDDATAEIVDVLTGGLRRIRFGGRIDAKGVMERYGSTPLPPYIARAAEPADREQYQTVYAKEEGSVAAPTAGLHFTPDLLDQIRGGGVEIAELVLHVGPGTFKPVEVEDPARHTMHPEHYEVSSDTASTVNRARKEGRRIVAVGTTVARTLETAGKSGTVEAGAGWTSLFIYPPYRFRVVDALLTNFHLPRSTLLMLVAAFAGYENTMKAYRVAVEERYRFYSYGDAMAIV